jgi:hypothetical protein
MKKMFKCIYKGSYHLTPGKNYLISLNIGKSSLGMHHTLYNDIGKQHLVFEDELNNLFIDIEKIREEKLNELGI